MISRLCLDVHAFPFFSLQLYVQFNFPIVGQQPFWVQHVTFGCWVWFFFLCVFSSCFVINIVTPYAVTNVMKGLYDDAANMKIACKNIFFFFFPVW